MHLTLDEAPTRLRADVEAELLRIAQEAITNARKHAAARNLWVDCRTDPPRARLTIGDDGRGHGTGRRDDSYGIAIMRERAQRIGAHASKSPASPRRTKPAEPVVQVKVADDTSCPLDRRR